MEHGRLVTLVDDADRYEHHARTEVQRRTHEEIDIGLFELELAALLQALDDGVLDLELADDVLAWDLVDRTWSKVPTVERVDAHLELQARARFAVDAPAPAAAEVRSAER
jgi:hypothetical protein